MLRQLGRGVVWTYASIGITGILQVGVVAVTARLLPTEAFGLMAMANVIVRFGGYFAQLGVGRALVQRAHIDDDDVRAAFTSSTVLGIATAAIVYASAPLAAEYFQTEEVIGVIRWLALTFVFSGAGATGRALLQRRLQFRVVSGIEIAAYAFGYAAPTLTLAYAGFGVWSLVAGAVGQVLVSSASAMLVTRHGLRPTLRIDAHRRLLGFGVKVSGISVLEFIGSTLDTLVIGRFGTPSQLGIYNRAFVLASLPTYQVHHGMSRVLFPVLSRGRSDPEAFAHTLAVASRTAIKLLVPLGIGMALAAPELVRVVLGERWLKAIPVLTVLAPALAINLLSTFPAQALEALGRLRSKAMVQGVYVVLLGSALVLTALEGLDLRTVTLVVAIAIGLRTTALYVLIVRAAAVAPSFIKSSVRAALVAAVVTSAAYVPTLALFRFLDASTNLTLAIAIAIGVLVLLALFRREVVRSIRARAQHRDRDA